MAKKKIAKKTKVKPSSSAKKSQGWPLQREVLYRPARMKYVRKLEVSKNCVFCEASKEVSFSSLCVYQSQHSMVVLNKFPYNSGHVLVLPKKHKGEIFTLTEDEFTDLNHTLRLAMKALTETYQPGGINVGLNHGKDAGAGIPEHLHYHVIPRWAGDLNFYPLIAEIKVVVENLDQTYDRLIHFFKAHKETL